VKKTKKSEAQHLTRDDPEFGWTNKKEENKEGDRQGETIS